MLSSIITQKNTLEINGNSFILFFQVIRYEQFFEKFGTISLDMKDLLFGFLSHQLALTLNLLEE